MNFQQQQTINHFLKFVAPGTPLREGIENVLRAKTGGLIVVGYNEKVKSLVEGGFSIDCSFSSASLYELAKMDGAIILSDHGEKILFANTQLIPDSSIISSETGIRHRTAERVAKQTGQLVISISQRRSVITLYKGNIRYSLKDIGVILTKANQAMQTLEKYRTVMDKGLVNLGALEFEEMVTFQELTQAIHRIEMVLRIRDEIRNYINELGTEGRLISMQMSELVANVETEAKLLIKDYMSLHGLPPEKILSRLRTLNSDDLLNEHIVVRHLGYIQSNDSSEEVILPRGYRALNRIPRLPQPIISKLAESFDGLNSIMKATIQDLVKVDGVGTKRAKKIKDGLERIQEQLFIDRVV
ncbi:DNA integrity scanning diadenylate cyclase DisA [Tuberibacillus sp. Marseille-P3662]|uniref:DNA integrity scanning diadenylate cyclase DisA n=1 Tax=Tuberibacillus sp. Marseille-P3662 TaxID=1965358 RepID=UPI000A1CEEE0|nr:DNA integrity scanning diadenylate cyclase DisA [Tuberibacillus sp. Marseille-P3662]